MPEEILVANNPNYGPPLVNQKYTPLKGIGFDRGKQPTYSKLVTNRADWLRALNRLGQPLRLATNGWPQVVAGEANHRPPLVVVSSGRSTWIQYAIDAGMRQLRALDIPQFDNVSDLRALTALDRQEISPPIYMPQRLGEAPNRNVYIVVHWPEYWTYQEALAGTGIIPVGWGFVQNGAAPKAPPLVGFGASRFAALEFCKYLRRQAGNPWNLAWLVDDNVIALAKFAGLVKVEDAVTRAAEVGHCVCAGFKGETKPSTQFEIKQWADAEISSNSGGQADDLPTPAPPGGLVQQMSLWNVAYLDQQNQNFGPIYIASAEDVSIINYFFEEGIQYLSYTGIAVKKEAVTRPDDGNAAKVVNQSRQDLATWMTGLENPPENPQQGDNKLPPPLWVRGLGASSVQTLGAFIVEVVLPASKESKEANNGSTQATAKCQAVEQITAGALRAGCVTPEAIAAAFKVNGDNQQAVIPVNPPPRPAQGQP